MSSHTHALNLMLLFLTLRMYLEGLREAFVAIDLAIFYSEEQLRSRDFLAPDFMVVLDTPNIARRSWVTWHEGGRTPNIVIEMLSSGTAGRDRGDKQEIYEQRLHVNEYFQYDPVRHVGAAFRLNGPHFEAITAEDGPRWYCEQLDLYLTVWDGEFQGVRNRWLRWAKPDGTLLPTPEELLARYRERFGDLPQGSEQA